MRMFWGKLFISCSFGYLFGISQKKLTLTFTVGEIVLDGLLGHALASEMLVSLGKS
jgi:hypothetical protein